MIERPNLQHLWYHFLQYVLRLVGVLGYHVRYSGQHNIPTTGGALVVSNHQSHFDPPLVGIGGMRPMNFIARETLFRSRPFSWLLHSVGAFPLDREGIGLAGIKKALKLLKSGEMVVIFPEGTRTKDGEIGPFRPGFTTLAVRAKTAILPVAIEGAFACWPKKSPFPHLGTIHVHYGKPLMPADFADMDEQTLVAEVERRVHECFAELRSHAPFAK
jgi:1-acyl-sn-glycerol-3-phosphate acyltransferase